MKVRLSVAAALAATACSTQAQSSVTVFGLVDTSLRSVTNGGMRVNQLAEGGLAGSRLGFRSEEDLGGGLRAGAWLEAALNPDMGTIHASGKFWHRRSTVSLSGPWGELRAGRDVSPTFWNLVYFDAFGTSGVGSALNLVTHLGSGASTQVRTDNAVGYFLPSNLVGIYGQVMWAPGEGMAGNQYAGGRIGYQDAALDLVAGYSSTKTSTAHNFKVMNAGASYDFKTVRLFALTNIVKFGAKKQSTVEVGLTVPVGVGVLRASYHRADASGAGTDANDARMYALGYVHNLSKRTALYGTIAQVRNSGAASYAVGTPPPVVAGSTSKGYEVGLRHAF